ncbi:hypothetical protein EON67_03885 [archaeon]|nr:MAG: hypothetical protein EON67_03885 [archaeon]
MIEIHHLARPYISVRTICTHARAPGRGLLQVASTETGHIFGTIVYDGPTAAPDGDRTSVINLAELHVDIMDYIHPAVCSDSTFRSMWADFEWENKVNVSTNITYVAMAQCARAPC